MEPRGAPPGKPRQASGGSAAPDAASGPPAIPHERLEALRELFSTHIAGADDAGPPPGGVGLPKLPRQATRRIAWALGLATLLTLAELWAPPGGLSFFLLGLQGLMAVLWATTAVALVRGDRDLKLHRLGRIERVRTGLAWTVLAVLAGLLLTSLLSRVTLSLRMLDRADPTTGLGSYRTWVVVGYLAVFLGLLGRPGRLQRLAARVADSHARLMALSFGLAALLGALLLSLPVSLRAPTGLGFADALFTAASAVSVTGLVTVDPGSTFTPFGQAVLLLLIQAGGLGIMVLYGFLALVVGRDLGLQGSAVMAQLIDVSSLAGLRRTVIRIVLLTLTLEALGAVLLYVAFGAYPEIQQRPTPDAPLSGAGSRAWAAVFHSVSAFTNAGFSLFPRGLAPLAGDWTVNLVVMALVFLGGLGFPVLFELLARADAWRRGQRRPRLSLHTRTVLVTSLILVAAGALLFLTLEWNRALGALAPADRPLAAFFQSIMLRTAGFSTVDYASMGAATLLACSALMFIGGSPGSTAGGVRTTTIAVLFATLWAELRNKDQVVLFDRAVGAGTSRRAIGMVLVSAVGAFVFGFALLLCLPDSKPLHVVLETMSALNTVGVSAGATAELGTGGKLLVTLAMLAGRIGPLTLALAFAAERGQQSRLGHPEERVGLG